MKINPFSVRRQDETSQVKSTVNLNIYTASISFDSSTFVARCRRISLAEAHCKLCLRTRVLEEDAVIAVLLCENSVTVKHGNLIFDL